MTEFIKAEYYSDFCSYFAHTQFTGKIQFNCIKIDIYRVFSVREFDSWPDYLVFLLVIFITGHSIWSSRLFIYS